VLEGAARVADLPTHPHLDVVHAPADGDTTIAALAGDLAGADAPVLVITADRALRSKVLEAGATTAGPNTLQNALP
jgi:ABC-type sugar transport system substrate-binding protein